MMPKTIEMLGEIGWEIVRYEPFQYVSIDQCIVHMRNPKSNPTNSKKFSGPSYDIKKFIFNLWSNPDLKRYLDNVSEVYLEFYSSVYRGNSCGRGFIVLNDVLSNIITDSWFEYVDKGLGIWKGAFEYDLSKL